VKKYPPEYALEFFEIVREIPDGETAILVENFEEVDEKYAGYYLQFHTDNKAKLFKYFESIGDSTGHGKKLFNMNPKGVLQVSLGNSGRKFFHFLMEKYTSFNTVLKEFGMPTDPSFEEKETITTNEVSNSVDPSTDDEEPVNNTQEDVQEEHSNENTSHEEDARHQEALEEATRQEDLEEETPKDPEEDQEDPVHEEESANLLQTGEDLSNEVTDQSNSFVEEDPENSEQDREESEIKASALYEEEEEEEENFGNPLESAYKTEPQSPITEESEIVNIFKENKDPVIYHDFQQSVDRFAEDLQKREISFGSQEVAASGLGIVSVIDKPGNNRETIMKDKESNLPSTTTPMSKNDANQIYTSKEAESMAQMLASLTMLASSTQDGTPNALDKVVSIVYGQRMSHLADVKVISPEDFDASVSILDTMDRTMTYKMFRRAIKSLWRNQDKEIVSRVLDEMLFQMELEEDDK
jgi:hypothetical protein